MERYKGIVITVAPSEGGECVVLLDYKRGLVRPVHPEKPSFDRGTFRLMHECSFLGEPKPEPWHPEDVKIALDTLRFTKILDYNQVKPMLKKHAIDINTFLALFQYEKVHPDTYKGPSIILLPISKQFTLWVYQRPESNKKQAKLLIGNIKVRITHWFSRDFWNSLKVGDRLEFAKEEGFLIITLSRPYQKDGLCYLLCSGILSPYDDWNM